MDEKDIENIPIEIKNTAYFVGIIIAAVLAIIATAIISWNLSREYLDGIPQITEKEVAMIVRDTFTEQECVLILGSITSNDYKISQEYINSNSVDILIHLRHDKFNCNKTHDLKLHFWHNVKFHDGWTLNGIDWPKETDCDCPVCGCLGSHKMEVI